MMVAPEGRPAAQPPLAPAFKRGLSFARYEQMTGGVRYAVRFYSPRLALRRATPLINAGGKGTCGADNVPTN